MNWLHSWWANLEPNIVTLGRIEMGTRTRLFGVLFVTMLTAAAASACLSTQTATSIGDVENDLPVYGVISTQQAAEVILALQDDPQFVLMDIRTSPEVEAAHLSGAVAVDFHSDSFRDDLAALDRDLIYLIYCRTGNRTGTTARLMEQLGFENVYDMGGGISQWLLAGYPVCMGPLDAEHTCTGEYPAI